MSEDTTASVEQPAIVLDEATARMLLINGTIHKLHLYQRAVKIASDFVVKDENGDVILSGSAGDYLVTDADNNPEMVVAFGEVYEKNSKKLSRMPKDRADV